MDTFVREFLRLLTLQDVNTRVVLVGATVLGIASGVIGSLAVLRRRSLVGDAVAHAALPGVCVAYMVVGERDFAAFMLGATVFGVLAAAFVALVRAHTRVKEDAAIALAIGGFFGLGIVLSRIIQNQPGGNRAGLDSFIFGKAASMVRDDAAMILAVSGSVLIITGLLYKEFKLLCFDRDFAAGQGWPTFSLDLLLMALICVCTVVGLPAVGVVLMVALLVIPSVAARFWTDRLGVMVLLSGLFGGAAGLLGTVLSATVPAPSGALSRGWPTGPLIVLVAAGVFLVSLLASPGRGLLADLVRRAALRRRIGVQNLLRDVYEALEPGNDLRAPWRAELVSRDGRARESALRWAGRDGLVVRTGDQWALSERGAREAVRVVRVHRLWELYLIEQADIAADHVDRDADQIEHVLSPEVIAQLESRLELAGRLPGTRAATVAVPSSPHPIGPARTPAEEGRGGRGGVGAVLVLALCVLGTWCAGDVRAGQAALAGISGAETAIHHVDAPEGVFGDGAWFHIGDYAVRDDDLWTIAVASCCSISCGVLGCFLVLRRLSLLGDAISHAILPGLALAFILSGTRSPAAMLAGAMCVGLLTALVSGALHRWGRVPEDASMGVVFTTLFAGGVMLVTVAARDVDLDPGCVLYGLIEFAPFDTLAIAGAQIPRSFVWLGASMAINIGLIAVFYKELKIACFDPALATTLGISATLVHYGLMTAVTATAVASFEAVGSILVVAMLVAPGATAQLLTDRLARMLWWAGAVALLSAVGGYVLAVYFNTSVAGMIATVSLGLFVAAAVGAPTHGVIARRVADRRPASPV